MTLPLPYRAASRLLWIALLAVEALARTRHLQEERRRLEALAEALLERTHAAEHFDRAEDVDITEWATSECWEANAEDGADVSIARAPEDAVALTVERLVHHREAAPKRDLVGGRGA